MNGFDPNTATYRKGDTIAGRWVVLNALNAGGQGEIYEVQHNWTKQTRVLKVLHRQLAADVEFRSRIQREATSLGTLRHANIVEVVDGGVTNDEHALPYFVMEALRGRTLQELLTEWGPLDVKNFCHLAADMCAALHTAHKNGHIHGDLKPDNLFVHFENNAARAIVLDFGIAVQITEPGQAAPIVALTPSYASPEHFLSNTITTRSDIYSLGVVFYVMLTGTLPFQEREDEAYFAEAHVHTPPAPLPQSLPDELRTTVMQMLAKDPAQRQTDFFVVGAVLNKIFALYKSQEDASAPTKLDPFTQYIADSKSTTNIPSGPKSIPAKKSVQFVPLGPATPEGGLRTPKKVVTQPSTRGPRPITVPPAKVQILYPRTPQYFGQQQPTANDAAPIRRLDDAVTDPDGPLFDEMGVRKEARAPAMDINATDPGGAPLFAAEPLSPDDSWSDLADAHPTDPGGTPLFEPPVAAAPQPIATPPEPWFVFAFPGMAPRAASDVPPAPAPAVRQPPPSIRTAPIPKPKTEIAHGEIARVPPPSRVVPALPPKRELASSESSVKPARESSRAQSKRVSRGWSAVIALSLLLGAATGFVFLDPLKISQGSTRARPSSLSDAGTTPARVAAPAQAAATETEGAPR